MNQYSFNYHDYDIRVDPVKTEIREDIEQLLKSSATRASFNGRERNEDEMIKHLIRGKLAEVHIRNCKKNFVRISEEVVKSHLQSHHFYTRLLQKNGPNSLVNWKYHDIVDVSSETIVEVKAWVNAKRFTAKGITELADRMTKSNGFFWSDVVYVYDFEPQTMNYTLAYKFRWTDVRRGFECIMKGVGF